MRRPFTIFFLFLSFITPAQVKFGIKGGMNLSSFIFKQKYSGYTKASGDYIPRLNAGMMIEIPLNDKDNWFLYTGPYYSGKGTKYGRTFPLTKNDSITIHLNYIELPFSFGYKFSEGNENRIITQAGVYAAYGFKGVILYKNDPVHTKRNVHRKDNYYKRIDAGFSLTAMYEIRSKWGIRADYSRSFLDITRYRNKENNNVFGCSFFWYFGKKKEKED
jgi:hypothetical protein